MNYNNDNKKITYQIDNKLVCHNRDKINGCIIGGAIGDALGYPVEFLIEKEIPDKYKHNLELKDILYELCDDIYNGCPYDNSDELRIKKWKEKYVNIG